MSLKDLLVHVDAGVAAMPRVELAVNLAQRHAAHLTALHVMALPPIPTYVQAQIPQGVLESQRAGMREQAAKLERAVRAAALAAGVDVEWRAVEGPIVETVILHGRHVDLAVIGQSAPDDSGSSLAPDLPDRLALEAGRPVLIVPRYGTYKTVGERVVVAWNGSREGARAVNDALPLMSKASMVTVLSINPEGVPDRRIPGADISLHLARHGIKAEAATTRAEDIAVGDVLLSRAADLGADLIVMGAYGHSRVREIVLGGATRHILQYMTAPVLMSH